ncbi:hypothetical protein OAK91_02265, partial [Planctomycetaceae bacterium]|nr:hypothetical protein [Planctomycetaceae bacterium]
MNIKTQPRTASAQVSFRSGFTLVEMLVSVGLVLLIMLLMANVYGLATETFSRQKGLAENDQQARAISTILRGDLRARTAQNVQAFIPNENPNDPNGKDGQTLGYFSYSENNPNDDTDDTLSFSVEVDVNDSRDNSTNSIFSGRSTLILDTTDNWLANNVDEDNDGTDDNPEEIYLWLGQNPYQPEADDADFVSVTIPPGTPALATDGLNSSGKSSVAEVCYFMRGSKLYRRVLLIRDPYDTEDRKDMVSNTVNDYMSEPYPGGNVGIVYAPFGTGHFYRDFDYSAFLEFDTTTGNAIAPQFMNRLSSLNNSNNVEFCIANPNNRFGHNPFDSTA